MSISHTSRGPLGLAGAVLAGGLSAVFFAVALAYAESMLIFLAYLAVIPLFVVGLGLGSFAGLIATISGIIGLYLTAPLNIVLTYVLLNSAPALLLIYLALRYRTGTDEKIYWYPEGYLLTAITLYPCALFLVFLVGTSGTEGGLLALTTQFMTEATAQIKGQMDAATTAQLSTVMDRVVRFIPALAGCAWIVVTMVGMIAAQTLLQKQKWNLRTGFTLNELHIPNKLVYVAAAAGLVGMMAPAPYDYMGTNFSILLCVPFFFVGLAVVHAWAATTKMPTLTRVVFYIVLIMIVWSALLVAVLGVVDQWVNFRRRFAAGPKLS